MHNGQIDGFESVRKTADMLIPDQLYLHLQGATDSEAFSWWRSGMD
jgi:glutamine amidotransferase